MTPYESGQKCPQYKLISPKQLKERLSKSLGVPIGINAIYDLVKRKEFPSVKIGRQYYIIEDKISEWLLEQTSKRKR